MSGRVVVFEGAVVDANISGAAIVVGGTVRGNLSASTRVEILPSGVLTGSLKTGSFSAADGVPSRVRSGSSPRVAGRRRSRSAASASARRRSAARRTGSGLNLGDLLEDSRWLRQGLQIASGVIVVGVLVFGGVAWYRSHEARGAAAVAEAASARPAGHHAREPGPGGACAGGRSAEYPRAGGI